MWQLSAYDIFYSFHEQHCCNLWGTKNKSNGFLIFGERDFSKVTDTSSSVYIQIWFSPSISDPLLFPSIWTGKPIIRDTCVTNDIKTTLFLSRSVHTFPTLKDYICRWQHHLSVSTQSRSKSSTMRHLCPEKRVAHRPMTSDSDEYFILFYVARPSLVEFYTSSHEEAWRRLIR